MKILGVIVGVVTILIGLSFSSFQVFAAGNTPEDEYTKGLINEKYTKQNSFVCNKQAFQVPSYFPFGDKWTYKNDNKNDKTSYNKKPSETGLFLTANEYECNADSFYAVLGLKENCRGEHICIDSSFSYNKVESYVINEIRSAFSMYTKEIELNKNMIGYFVPSECSVYCNTARIIWFDYNVNRIFIISTKNPQNNKEVIDELVKSANSYINSSK